MLIMLELIKLENVFAWLFFHLLPKQLSTCLDFPLLLLLLLFSCLMFCSHLGQESSRELTSLPSCSFLPISSSPLIHRLRNTEKSADEQLNMALPQGDKVTPVCVDGRVCVEEWVGSKCNKRIRGIKEGRCLEEVQICAKQRAKSWVVLHRL